MACPVSTHWGRDKWMPFRRWHFGNVWILIKISLKFVPKGPINNIPAMVQIMAWHHPGDKPLSEPVMVSLPMPIWVAWPQRVKATFEWASLHLKPLRIPLFNSLLTMNKKIKAPRYWPLVQRIHWEPVTSPHKEPVMSEALPHHDVIMGHKKTNIPQVVFCSTL